MRFRGAPAGGKGRVACTGRAGATSGCRVSPQPAEPPGRAPRSALTATLAGAPQYCVVPNICSQLDLDIALKPEQDLKPNPSVDDCHMSGGSFDPSIA